MALLHALLIFRLLPDGFTNRDLRDLISELTGTPFTTGQLTYDLRRLRTHGLIERRPHSHRYRVTDTGHEQALFLTRAHDRLLRTGLADITDDHRSGPLRTATRTYQKAIDNLMEQSRLTT